MSTIDDDKSSSHVSAPKATSIESFSKSTTSTNTEQLNATDNTSGPVFTLFSSLPPELRLKIWSHTLRGPSLIPLTVIPLKPIPFIRHGRVSSIWPIDSFRPPDSIGAITIPLHLTTVNPAERAEVSASRVNLSNLSCFHSTTPPPEIIYVNHEAHEIVTKAFSKAFASHCVVATTWFDYEHDTLLLEIGTSLTPAGNGLFEEVVSRMFLAERSLVKHVCVDLRLCNDNDRTIYMWASWFLAMFPNCRTFTLELASTRMVGEMPDDLRLRAMEEKVDMWAYCFQNYRRFGTVRYEVTGWKEYVKEVHGDKGLIVRECRIDQLSGNGECVGVCILMIPKTVD